MKNTHLDHPIRLYWGENYALKPQTVVFAIKKALAESVKTINLYPGNLQDAVIKNFANIYHVPVKSIILGTGIEGLLVNIFWVFVKAGDEIITLSPTFSAYEHNAKSRGAGVVTITVGLETKVTAEEVLAKVTGRTKLICIASPNTTTGIYHISKKDIIKILKKFKGLVIIDECYFGIGKKTVINLMHKFDNLLGLRSASKNWGLAGIRLGFGIGSTKIIDKLEKHTIALAPDSLPTATYLVMLAVLPYHHELESAYKKFQKEFVAQLKKIPGIKVYETESTYIPVEVKNAIPLLTVISRMKSYGFELKDTSDLDYLLFTVPPKKYWDAAISCFKKSLALI